MLCGLCRQDRADLRDRPDPRDLAGLRDRAGLRDQPEPRDRPHPRDLAGLRDLADLRDRPELQGGGIRRLPDPRGTGSAQHRSQARLSTTAIKMAVVDEVDVRTAPATRRRVLTAPGIAAKDLNAGARDLGCPPMTVDGDTTASGRSVGARGLSPPAAHQGA